MKRRVGSYRRWLLITLLGVLVFFGILLASHEPEEGSDIYILATATSGGTFYPVGVALATLTKQVLEPEHGIALAAISSAGSEENLRLMRSGEAKFSILQGLYGAWAWTGAGRLANEPPFQDLRSVTALWPNVEHFVIRERLAETGTVSDLTLLKGRRFSIGARYSGTEGSNRHILRALGLDPDEDFGLVYQGYGASADAFQNRLVDGMNTPAGVPVGAVTRTLATADARLLGFEEEHLSRVNRDFAGLWQFFHIPADTYPNQPDAVRTIAQANLLAVTADVPDEHVYQVLATLYDNIGFLHAYHAATRAMTLDKALDGLSVPLHPGALQFYQDRGLEIPAALLPPDAADQGT